MKKIAAGEKIPPLAYRKLQSALAGEIRRYEKCRALLGVSRQDVVPQIEAGDGWFAL